MHLTISNPTEYHAALYIRLSKEDECEGPSQSVTNQQSLLNEFVKEHRIDVYDTYIDATDIIGLKQNPTNGCRFSPIFSFIEHFAIQIEEMLLQKQRRKTEDGKGKAFVDFSKSMNAFRHFSEMDMPDIIQEIPIVELHPFPDHPFGVRDDDTMQETVESIREYGVLVPAIARPREDGGYELISGHRRKHACELAGINTMPVIVKDIDRNAATIIMVDSNLQRENILPSEKAKAYKMKLEAIKRQGARHDLTSDQVGRKFESADLVAQQSSDSKTQVRRYIRLTELEPELQKMVDEGKIGMTPAVELSYLKPDEQKLLIDTIDSEQATPSLSQAQRMKRLSQEGKLNDDTMLGIMMEQKKPENWNLTLPMDKIKRYFPRSYTPQRMEETIIKLLENWMKKRQRDQQR